MHLPGPHAENTLPNAFFGHPVDLKLKTRKSGRIDSLKTAARWQMSSPENRVKTEQKTHYGTLQINIYITTNLCSYIIEQ